VVHMDDLGAAGGGRFGSTISGITVDNKTHSITRRATGP
jgi:hypothetical protein